MRRRLHIFLIGFAFAFGLLTLAGAGFAWSLGPAPLGKDMDYSHLVLARDGHLLRAYATPAGRWRLPATPQDVDPRFLKLLFAYEDKRFYDHHGVDPIAMARAAFQFVTTGHVVSGGSTLTMQVARLLEPREHRTVTAKLRQIVRALEAKSDRSVPEEFFHDMLDEQFSEDETLLQLETAINWGRYAELFDFDVSRRRFILPEKLAEHEHESSAEIDA